jgi:hypothetical protein
MVFTDRHLSIPEIKDKILDATDIEHSFISYEGFDTSFQVDLIGHTIGYTQMRIPYINRLAKYDEALLEQ